MGVFVVLSAGQVLRNVRGMVVEQYTEGTEEISEGMFPFQEYSRCPAVLHVIPRIQGAEASLIHPPEFSLYHHHLISRGLSPCPHMRKKPCTPWQRVKATTSLGTTAVVVAS